MARVELDAHRRFISELLDGTKQYKAPSFQRPYVWKRKEWIRLCEDIERLTEPTDQESPSHFLGALVLLDQSANATAGLRRFLIVDGQQRLATVFVYLTALAAEMNRVGLDGSNLVGQYLVNQYHDPGGPKVLPTELDLTQLRTVVSSAGFGDKIKIPVALGDTTGNLLNAFVFLRRRIRDRQTKALEVARLEAPALSEEAQLKIRQEVVQDLQDAVLTRLKTVEIMLGDGDEPYQVFTTLNTIGVSLRGVDLVRSEVFFRSASDLSSASVLFENYWKPIEAVLGDDSDRYFFPYALMRNSATRKSDLFINLRRIWANEQPAEIVADIALDILPFLALKRTAPQLEASVKTLAGVLGRTWLLPEALSPYVARMRRYSLPDVALPYAMRVLREAEAGTLADEQAIADLSLLEAFLVRRAIKGIEPTGLHAVFKTLWDETDNGDPGRFIAAILKRTTVDFPDDETFRKAIEDGPLYRRGSIKSYVLFEYELHIRHDAGINYDRVHIETIDHVMPQEPGVGWKWISASDHRALIDTWANLVPLSRPDNASKGNTEWPAIRAYIEDESEYKSARRLAKEHETWDATTIRNRSKLLAAWALDRWPRPTPAE